jgi:hypothetical protein
LLPQAESHAALAAAPRGVSSARSAELTRATAVILLFVLSAVIYLGNAGFPALLDDADASHALVSREMLQRHDWVILYMNGIRYLMKAPLHYWAVAMSYAALGQNEFSTRSPLALAMIGLALLVNAFARRFFGVRAGFYSGLVVCTSAGFFLFTRIMIPEAIYALEFTAIFYLFLRGWTGSLNPRAAYWLGHADPRLGWRDFSAGHSVSVHCRNAVLGSMARAAPLFERGNLSAGSGAVAHSCKSSRK